MRVGRVGVREYEEVAREGLRGVQRGTGDIMTVAAEADCVY